MVMKNETIRNKIIERVNEDIKRNDIDKLHELLMDLDSLISNLKKTYNHTFKKAGLGILR